MSQSTKIDQGTELDTDMADDLRPPCERVGFATGDPCTNAAVWWVRHTPPRCCAKQVQTDVVLVCEGCLTETREEATLHMIHGACRHYWNAWPRVTGMGLIGQ